jgi:hypothetical protein
MYIEGLPVEIPTPTRWNLIGRSMTAPPPQCSSVTFVSLRLHSCKEKFGVLFKNVAFYTFVWFLKIV